MRAGEFVTHDPPVKKSDYTPHLIPRGVNVRDLGLTPQQVIADDDERNARKFSSIDYPDGFELERYRQSPSQFDKHAYYLSML